MAVAATRDYQRRLLAVRGVVYAGVRRAWLTLDADRLDETWAEFLTAVLTVVLAGRTVSDALAVAYLQAVADEQVVDGASAAVAPLDAVVFAAALRSASVVSVKTAMTAGRPVAEASRNALVNSMGVADKAVRDAGRDRVRAVVGSSDRFRGWTRITTGRACPWCRSLTGTTLPATARMASHAHCGCVAEPVAA